MVSRVKAKATVGSNKGISSPPHFETHKHTHIYVFLVNEFETPQPIIVPHHSISSDDFSRSQMSLYYHN